MRLLDRYARILLGRRLVVPDRLTPWSSRDEDDERIPFEDEDD